MKILMVCLGNICRSPLAEGIMKAKAIQYQFDFEVDSAGTAAYHVGELPDERSIAVAKKYGIDLTDQRARQFIKSDFANFDIIFAMDQSNYNNILSLATDSSERNKVHLILNESHPNQNLEVPDPYYGGDQGFENVFSLLDNACEAFIKKQSS
ncbi:protein-tyrosine-phosphatase [Flavobacteriaceae bacterium UJ101]|nr:protein-tyrosine-phosphatase [Flavobacteriaceae bacterium UJ101]